MTVVDKKKRHQVRLQYQKGVPIREICQRYEISTSTLYNWVASKPKRGWIPQRVNQGVQDEIARLNYLGYSDRKIAKALRLGHGTVTLWRDRMGLPVVKERR